MRRILGYLFCFLFEHSRGNERGATMYAILVTLVSIVAIVIILTFGSQIQSALQDVLDFIKAKAI
jgi:Flp pilus assembly pilin Flp